MSILIAFLVAFITLNVPLITGAGIAQFDIKPRSYQAQFIHAGVLAIFACLLGIAAQIESVSVLVPILAVVCSVGTVEIENKLLSEQRTTNWQAYVSVGATLTFIGLYASSYSMVSGDFYATVLGMVATYSLTLFSLQLMQRRLNLAVIPNFLKGVPVLAVTLAILAMVFSGFTAIF